MMNLDKDEEEPSRAVLYTAREALSHSQVEACRASAESGNLFKMRVTEWVGAEEPAACGEEQKHS